MKFSRVALFYVLVSVCAPAAARAQDFYRGKTINVVVGLSAGGGYDLFARTLARHLGRHISGEPKVIVTNMPGAASLSAVLWLDNAAPKDGTVIVSFNHGLLGDFILSPERIRVDFRKLAWIGSPAEDLSACYMWHTKGPRDIAEIKAYGLIHFGQTAAGSSSDTLQHILTNLIGVKISTANGYPGSAEVRLAVERGELDGDCGAWAVNPPEWVREKKIFPFIKNSPAPDPDMSPDVPYAPDAVPDERGKAIARLLTASARIGRPLVASAQVPAERLGMLRKGFDETTHDPQFIADLRQQGLPWSPHDAAEALQLVESIAGAPADIIAAARKTMND